MSTLMIRCVRWIERILIGVGVLVALTGSSLAEESKMTEPSDPAAKPREAVEVAPPQEPERRASVKPKELFGRIMAVDRERGVLTIAQDIPLAPDAMTEVVLNEQTLVTRETQRLALEDLRPGEEYVRIRYVEVADRPIVLAITFEPLPNLQRMSGTSQAIDLINGELIVKPHGFFGGDPKRFTVNEATVITREGLRSYLTHLFIGDEVRVDYTTEGEIRTAHFVTVKPSKPSTGWFSGLGGRRNLQSQQPSGAGVGAPRPQ